MSRRLFLFTLGVLVVGGISGYVVGSMTHEHVPTETTAVTSTPVAPPSRETTTLITTPIALPPVAELLGCGRDVDVSTVVLWGRIAKTAESAIDSVLGSTHLPRRIAFNDCSGIVVAVIWTNDGTQYSQDQLARARAEAERVLGEIPVLIIVSDQGLGDWI